MCHAVYFTRVDTVVVCALSHPRYEVRRRYIFVTGDVPSRRRRDSPSRLDEDLSRLIDFVSATCLGPAFSFQLDFLEKLAN